MTTQEKKALRERLANRTKAEMDALWNDPDFRREHVAWEAEYKSEALLHKARTLAGLTQCALAEKMHTRRANISRIERGQNVTFATFARFLNACGYHFRISIFPIDRDAARAEQTAFA